MGIFSWFYRIFGTDDSKINTDLPTGNTDAKNHNSFGFEPFEIEKEIDSFEEIINIFHKSFEEMLKEFPSNNEDSSNTNILTVPFNTEGNQLSDEGEYNGIPKKNVMAQNYFLNSGSAPKTLNESPIRQTMYPGLNFGQSSSTSYRCGTFDGRMIEKESSTRQLQGGIIEKVIIMKDGNQKCVTTITENSHTGDKNCNKQLINLDESQLNEFEKRFSKF